MFRRKPVAKTEEACPCLDEASLGNILVKMGVITQQVLNDCMAECRTTMPTRLGEILVRRGVVSEHDIQLALLKQRILRGDRSIEIPLQLVDLAHAQQSRTMLGIERLVRSLVHPQKKPV